MIFLWTVPLNIQIQLMLWQKLFYESEGKKISSPSSVACAHSAVLTPVFLSFFLIGVEGQSVEICNTVDIRGETNREIAMRITSDLNSKDRFFTDLNGYQVGHQYILFILSLTHIHNKVYTVYASVCYKARQYSAGVGGRSGLVRGICGSLTEPARMWTDFTLNQNMLLNLPTNFSLMVLMI